MEAYRDLVGLAASLGFLGFVTSMNFNVSLHIPPEFQSGSMLDSFMWGFRATIPMAYYMWGVIKPTALILAVVILFWCFRGDGNSGMSRSSLAECEENCSVHWIPWRLSRVSFFWVYADSCGLKTSFLGNGGRNAATILSLRYSLSR